MNLPVMAENGEVLGRAGTRMNVPLRGEPKPLADGTSVRPYLQSDRSGVRHLCCETGFLGNPIEPLFVDRELFADLFTKPYLDHEPEWALVAVAEGRVAGYLLGSVRPDFDRVLIRCGFQTMSRMLFRLVCGRYSNHRRSRQFIRWLLTAGYWEQPKHPAASAHLHLNVERGHRGRGVARRLWETFEQRLRTAGVERVYGSFFSHPKRKPEAAYGRYGFRDFARCPTTLFKPELVDPVEVVCVCREL